MVTPRLHHPGGLLSPFVEYFGHANGRAGGRHDDACGQVRDRALPRGAATVVFDLGPRQQLDVYAADGRTPVPVPAAVVMGPHVSSYVCDIRADSHTMAVHFLPGGAAPFLPMPLQHLSNGFMSVDEVWGRDGLVLHQRLIEAPDVTLRFGLLEQFLASRARPSARHADVATALDAVERFPALTIASLGALTGLSPKRLIARFRSEVGLTPKSYARVRRFQAALHRLRTAPARGAEIAADLGYFDQAHFVREFRAFTSMTPSQYAQRRIRLPSHVPITG
jgi:AraC-like DNA-binding protein